MGKPRSNRRRVSAAVLLSGLARQRKIELRLARRLEAPFLYILDAARRSAERLESVEAFLRRVNAAVEEQRGSVRNVVRESGEASAQRGYERTLKDLRRLGVEAGDANVSETVLYEMNQKLDDETFRSLDVLPARLLKATEFLLSKRSLRPYAKKLARGLAKAASTYAEVRGELAANEDHGTGWWEWRSRGDDRVRGSHRDKPVGVGREVRQVGVMFSNGARYPRDPLAPIRETAGCRCHTRPVLPPTGGVGGSGGGGGSGDDSRGVPGQDDEPENLIRMLFDGEFLTREQIRVIREYVAGKGFYQEDNARPRPEHRKIMERLGIPHKPGQRYSQEYLHYLKHVLGLEEWPDGTTQQQYVQSIRELILNPRTVIVANIYDGRRQLSFVHASEELRGRLGYEWVLVEYVVRKQRWFTAFQPREELEHLYKDGRRIIRWIWHPLPERE